VQVVLVVLLEQVLKEEQEEHKEEQEEHKQEQEQEEHRVDKECLISVQ
jgi:hypothetical protein